MDYTEQYSEWLSAYIDGELDPALEEPLFTMLASHAELRQEMRELLALRRAARRDAAALIPPLSTTAAVFQAAGIGASSAVAVSALRKLWVPVASALVGGVLTWLGMTLWQKPSVERTTVQTVVKPETTVVERVVYRTRTVYVPRKQEPIAGETTSPSEPRRELAATPAVPSTTLAPLAELQSITFAPQPYVVRHYQLPAELSDPTVAYTPELAEIGTQRSSHFRVFLRGLGTTSLVTVPQQPDRTSLLNTSALGIFYAFDDHNAVGIEIGREPFAMEFYGYQEDTRLRYQAYPALLWGTVNYQYRFALGRHVEPFVQLGVGATEFGFLGRTTLGLVYSPSPTLGVMLGLEGALMRYVYQSTPYLTPNVGVTYGVMFRF